MFPFRHILAPVDFSERSLAMMPYVKALASKFDAEVTLLHVVNPVVTVPPIGNTGPTLVREDRPPLVEEGRRLEEFGRAELEGLRVRRFVYEGDPVSQIVEYTQTENVDLLVLSTHGYGAVRRFLIGSTAAKILHDAACPVLTGARGQLTGGGFTRVVCGLAGATHDRETLATAAQIAAAFGAPLATVHVGSEDERDCVESLVRQAGVQVGGVEVRGGDVAKGVCGFAESSGADLLVIGRSGAKEESDEVWSDAYAIIRQAPCPVLSV